MIIPCSFTSKSIRPLVREPTPLPPIVPSAAPELLEVSEVDTTSLIDTELSKPPRKRASPARDSGTLNPKCASICEE